MIFQLGALFLNGAKNNPGVTAVFLLLFHRADATPSTSGGFWCRQRGLCVFELEGQQPRGPGTLVHISLPPALLCTACETPASEFTSLRPGALRSVTKLFT